MNVGNLIGGVASGFNALSSLIGSRDSKNIEAAKDMQRFNDAQQRAMIQDSAMLQKNGLKRAGLSVASLNGGFSPANAPTASLPNLTSDAQMAESRTAAVSSLAGLLQNAPIAEAQKEALQSQRDLNKAQLPKIEEEKQNIANANQYFLESKDKMLATLDAELQQKIASKDLTEAQKDKAKEELNMIKQEINQITFNMKNTAALTASQIARNRQEITESLSRTSLNKALESEASSRTLLNRLNANFVRLGIGGNDSVSTLLRVASASPELYEKLKSSIIEMVNKVNPLAFNVTEMLMNGIDEIRKFLQDKTNKFFNKIYNGHYEMVNGKATWISEK
jgi:hypothetical protein